MSDHRTILLGMNNPYGDRPNTALYPAPELSAGWRLWRMLAEVGRSRGLEIRRKHYLEAFDRRNVLNAVEWSRADAELAAQDVLPTLAGRRLVILGAETADVLGLPRTDIGEWRQTHLPIFPDFNPSAKISDIDIIEDRADYTCLPHPSGRNRIYNDTDTRWRAGAVLLKEFMTSEVAQGLALRPPTG